MLFCENSRAQPFPAQKPCKGTILAVYYEDCEDYNMQFVGCVPHHTFTFLLPSYFSPNFLESNRHNLFFCLAIMEMIIIIEELWNRASIDPSF